MKFTPLPLHSVLLAVALTLCGTAALRAQAGSETTTTTSEDNVTFGHGTPVTLTQIGGSVLSVANATGIISSVGGLISSVPPSITTPGLYGSVNGLQVKKTKSGSSDRVKAAVAVLNTSNASLHNVTATVYLSADNTLSADDMSLLTLHLSDYVAQGKIGKHKTLSLPLNHKVPSLLASYLNGKYLIVVLSADDLGSLPSTPIVVGPITLP